MAAVVGKMKFDGAACGGAGFNAECNYSHGCSADTNASEGRENLWVVAVLVTMLVVAMVKVVAMVAVLMMVAWIVVVIVKAM